jgi:hypothetical protein
MRSLKDVEKSVAGARIHTSGPANDARLKDLLRELSESKETSAARGPTEAGPHLIRSVAYLASVAAVIVALAWLLHTRPAPQENEPAHISSPSTSRILLLTEVSLERAFRRGGIQAVENQCEKALAQPRPEPIGPTMKELLEELAGNNENTGGTSL